jgi:hypothetical protein
MAHMYIHHISINIHLFFLHISILLGRLAVPDPSHRLEIQWKKNYCIVGYNTEYFSVLNPTILLCCIVGYSTPLRFCCGVGYKGRKTPALRDTMEKHLLAILRILPVVSRNGNNLGCCIPIQRKTFSVVSHKGKNSSVVSHNGKKPLPLYPTMAKNFKLK